MNWSPQQDAALLAVKRWLAEKPKQVFYLAGVGGSGKSTVVKEIVAGYPGRVAYGAFTGKAAAVMRAKGCDGATTIHKMIYSPNAKSMRRLVDLKRELSVLAPDDAARWQVERDVAHEERAHRSPSFSLATTRESFAADLIVVDEVSTVNESMGRDLLSLGKPVLVLGDPEQLPPVGGAGFFTNGEPDVFLTEVHRQAKDSPIIRMATIVREGGRLELGQYGDDCAVLDKAPAPEEVMAFDQILVGRNVKRRAVNARCRALLGKVSPVPEVGDKLVCLRNDHRVGILNGETFRATAPAERVGDRVFLTIKAEPLHGTPEQSDEDLAEFADLEAHVANFLGQEVSATERMDAQEFDWGYAMTVSKFQGSEAPAVLVFDESSFFRQDARRWLYTALTRASERVTVVRS